MELWGIRGIESSIATLENLCKLNRLNSLQNSPILKVFTGSVISTPTKPKGKHTRQILPIDNNS
ncbi:hypothetical protein BC936DRAFT_148888 [Jimgerdemannia flammicorona]|uniref:Uncharacterized protein n=1 Tax=Jimgerdemannia flammicorona TaxID=994334 RepID=A0A433D233_9FUNG|nr:hypothetical protein BC936DRAFT_148888 [Jimgerdemannia flammicorona]